MKQLSFLSSLKQSSDVTTNPTPTSDVLQSVVYWKLCVDGASRNNPGPSGAGVFLVKNDKPVFRHGYYLGNNKTNNQAEYFALLLGLFHYRELVKDNHKDNVLLVVSDSQLLIRQLEGRYRVKHEGLKPLYEMVRMLLSGVNVEYAHVLREDNTEADRLANLGIDEKKRVPTTFLALLQRYGIPF